MACPEKMWGDQRIQQWSQSHLKKEDELPLWRSDRWRTQGHLLESSSLQKQISQRILPQAEFLGPSLLRWHRLGSCQESHSDQRSGKLRFLLGLLRHRNSGKRHSSQENPQKAHEIRPFWAAAGRVRQGQLQRVQWRVDGLDLWLLDRERTPKWKEVQVHRKLQWLQQRRWQVENQQLQEHPS